MLKNHRQHKSGIIAAALRERCLQAALRPGDLLPSTHEVAESFQVSQMTAHQALQQLKSEGLVYRVQGSGTYLKTSLSPPKRIGIADCSITMLYNEEMQQIQNQVISFCIEFLTEHHYDVQTVSYPELNNEKTAARLLESVDGLLLSFNYVDSGIINKLRKAKIPVVVYRHEFIAELPFSQVIFDFSHGIQTALESAALNPDDPPVLLYEHSRSATYRLNLFLEQLQKLGYSSEKLMIHEVNATSRTVDCYRLARTAGSRWHGKLLICMIDDIAAAIISALRTEQLYPGRNYRLLSIGNSEEYGFQFLENPFLASIDMPLQQMAIESCQLLTALTEKSGTSQHIIKIPGNFVMRPSLFLDTELKSAWEEDVSHPAIILKNRNNSEIK